MQITIKATNLGNIQKSLSTFGKAVAEVSADDMFQAMQRAGEKAIPWYGGGSYGIPDRGYKRTGAYGSSRQVVRIGAASRMTVTAGHAVLVGGDSTGAGQASIHTGYWPRISDVVDEELIQLTETLREDAAELARFYFNA